MMKYIVGALLCLISLTGFAQKYDIELQVDCSNPEHCEKTVGISDTSPYYIDTWVNSSGFASEDYRGTQQAYVLGMNSWDYQVSFAVDCFEFLEPRRLPDGDGTEHVTASLDYFMETNEIFLSNCKANFDCHEDSCQGQQSYPE